MSTYALLFWFLYSTQTNGEPRRKDKCPTKGGNGMGTVLFTAADVHKQCWTPDEIAVLTTRMILEDLIPDIAVLNVDSNEYVDDTVNYFRLLIEVVKSATSGRKRHITLRALTDLLGGYLQYAVLPISRHAYYAGLIDYSSMEKLIQLFEELKWFLRTNGQGWSRPTEAQPPLEVQPINFDGETPKNAKSCCSRLIYYENEQHTKENNCTVIKTDVVFPTPFFDTKVRPSAIAVPFRRYALRNIQSRKAAYLLQKYFVAAVKCLREKRSSNEAITTFQNDFYSWLEKEVMPKLHDDKFYSAFGGILRVEETLKTLGAIASSATTCAPDGEEDVGGVSSKMTSKTSKSSVVLLVMLASILAWFILGTAFICYRMRKNQRQGDGDTSSTSSRWSLFSRSTKRRSSTTPYSSSPSSDGERAKRVCYPPNRDTTKKLASITEMSEFSANEQPQEDPKKVSFRRKPPGEVSMKPCPKLTERSTSMSSSKTRQANIDQCWCDRYLDGGDESVETKRRPEAEEVVTRGDSFEKPARGSLHGTHPREVDDASKDKGSETVTSTVGTGLESDGNAAATEEDDKKGSEYTGGVSSVESSAVESSVEEKTVVENKGKAAADSHIYACHSSLTGAYANKKSEKDNRYIFGYDFQTSSSDFSDDDTDLRTSTSK